MSRSSAMNSHDNANMHNSQSYPSPTAVPISDPFFAHQQRLSPSDNAPLAAQLSRAGHPMMAAPMNGGGEIPTHHHPGNDLRPPSDQLAEMDPDASHDTSFGDPSAPRKRSKVSRACDECRRKKIRCDATSESGVEQCSSCKRTGVRCQFSRVPMKRGPSKGYIKELADRLITLENSMMPGHSSDLQYTPLEPTERSPGVSEDYSPPSANPAGHSRPTRKRTHSASTDFQSPNYSHPSLPQRPSLGGWPPQDPSRHLPLPPAGLQNPPTPQSSSSMMDPNQAHQGRPQYSPNGVSQPHWRPGLSETAGRENINPVFDQAEMRSSDHDHSDAPVEWDEKAIEEYYHLIHPTLPLLPNTSVQLKARLSTCPTGLREAFLEALYATVRGFPTSSISATPEQQSTRKANNLLAASQYDQMASRSPSTNLVYLQTMVLMTLEADNHGPTAVKRQLGPPRGVWLSSAVGLAYFLRLHAAPERERAEDDEMDSDEKLGRRIWWLLVTLDRWHALSTASPMFIPDSVVSLMPGDQQLLGDSIFHLARLSVVFGHISEVCFSNEATNGPLIGRLLFGELDLFRESIEAQFSALPIVHLAYWHAKTLVKRLSSSNAHDLLEPVQQMTSLLEGSPTPVTPLSHHFTALAALTLMELVDVQETKEGAWTSLQELQETLNRGPGLSANEESVGWDSAVRDVLARKVQQQHQSGPSTTTTTTTTNQGGLQRLADLAVGERGTADPSSSSSQGAGESAAERFDPTVLTRHGYLTVLAEDNVR